MVAMEPDTTVFSEDTEVSMEMDPTVQRFRCKQLRAELDILALKDLKSEVLFYFSIHRTVIIFDIYSRIMRKPTFSICNNKDADQLCGTAKLISAIVFTTGIVHFLYFLNTNISALSFLLLLYSRICVRPGMKPQC